MKYWKRAITKTMRGFTADQYTKMEPITSGTERTLNIGATDMDKVSTVTKTEPRMLDIGNGHKNTVRASKRMQTEKSKTVGLWMISLLVSRNLKASKASGRPCQIP